MTLEEVRDALSDVFDRDLQYNGNTVVFTFESHGDAMGKIVKARSALDKIKDVCSA